jgi:hypothetical protein
VLACFLCEHLAKDTNRRRSSSISSSSINSIISSDDGDGDDDLTELWASGHRSVCGPPEDNKKRTRKGIRYYR